MRWWVSGDLAMTALSVVIPAHDEAAWLPACLGALLASDPVEGGAEVIVVPNGCRDDTAGVARSHAGAFAAKGWRLEVIERAEGGKPGALTAGDAAARGRVIAYLDADVTVSPPLLAQLARALSGEAPRYGSGTARVTTRGLVSTLYARFWRTTPFVSTGVPGFGLFAVNRAGRARWADWPRIISDDTFARLMFAPAERVSVPATYDWPMIEGFAPLVRVRRRQDAGVAEIGALYPGLLENRDTDRGPPPWRRALRDPAGFAAYCAVRAAVLLPVARGGGGWARGR
jgi:glycosyltransferase involved in cell wall biosynthesis